ncbi:MAG: hypothetical protein GX043_01955 [Desulfovibrionales bacterium]|nr:hypothetical protein [Desulfovibrionales bacterium]
MSIWYALTPLDTLFFRGSEPMEAGQLTSETLFPPPVSVLQGAFRTEVLRQKKISYAAYKKGENIPTSVLEAIGQCGEAAPFVFTGVLIKRGERIYAPAPSAWFVDLSEKPKKGVDFHGAEIMHPQYLEMNNPLAMRVSCGTAPLVAAQHEALSLAGYWVEISLLSLLPKKLGSDDVVLASELFDLEHCTGIALDANRKVKEGQIYSSTHIRLQDGVQILVGIDRDLGLEPQGILRLGGEQRVCAYVHCSAPKLPNGEGRYYTTLTPLALTSEVLEKVICAAKLQILAGWDLSIGFHKPTTTWLPAGSIVTQAINKSCIPFIVSK